MCKKISDFLKQNFIENLNFFEKKNKVKIDIISDNSLIIPEYVIDMKNKSKKTIELLEYFDKPRNLEVKVKDKVINFKNIKIRKKVFKKKKYFKESK